MRRTLDQAPRVWLRRFSGVTLVFVIAVLIAPLAMGLLQCLMPCCQAEATPSSNSIAAVNSCRMATCATRTEPAPRQEAARIAAREVASERTGELVIALASSADAGSNGSLLHSLPPPSPRGTDAPLHVLNSTFRI